MGLALLWGSIVNMAVVLSQRIFTDMDDDETHWKVSVGNKPLRLKVLRSREGKKKGYQNCEQAPSSGEGLLFMFEGERQRSFHMRNVGFDLDLLGFNEDGKFVCVVPMKSGGKKVYTTPVACKFIVETTPGWAADLGLEQCHLKILDFGD